MTVSDILLVETDDKIFSYQVSEEGTKLHNLLNKNEDFEEFVWDEVAQSAFVKLKKAKESYDSKSLSHIQTFDDQLKPIMMSKTC